MLLYGEILEFYSLCHALFLTAIYFYFMAIGSIIQWFIFVPMCCFWCLFCVSFQYSFFGQRACKKCCDMDRISSSATAQSEQGQGQGQGTKRCCPYSAKTVTDHLLFSGTILLLYANIFFNYPECLSDNNAIENIFGIRGYAFLNFYYCILMAVEFNFGGLPNNKLAQAEENKVGKENQDGQKGKVVPTEQLL